MVPVIRWRSRAGPGTKSRLWRGVPVREEPKQVGVGRSGRPGRQMGGSSEVMASTDPAFVQTLDRLQAAGMTAQQALAGVTAQVVNQAYFLAVLDFFRASAWIVALLVPLIWLTRRAVSGGGLAAAD